MNGHIILPRMLEAEKIWFTADNHFGHANIIRFAQRPFSDIVEMDSVLVANWNAKVGPDDYVFHLGDFCLGNSAQAHEYFIQLNGRINVLGLPWHHDRRWLSAYMVGKHWPVAVVASQLVIEAPQYTAENRSMVLHLNHYPMQSWDRSHYNAVHLYGHVHQYQYSGDDYKMNVGVDVCNFEPISLAEIQTIMARKGWPNSKI